MSALRGGAATLALVALLAGCAAVQPNAPDAAGVSDPAPSESAAEAVVSDADADAAGAPRRGGFLAGFFGRGGPAPEADAVADDDAARPDPAAPVSDAASDGDAPVATETPETADATETPDAAPRAGFFARLFGAPRDPAAPDAAALPEGGLSYGEVGTLCGTAPDTLSDEIARHPASGRVRYRLFDTAPGTTEPRAFYLAGFDDGCLRRFTAALAVFGTAPVYEAIRYGAPAGTQPLSETDDAYDAIKRRVCGQGPRSPCGDRVARLQDGTVFVSVYERHGSNLRWKNLLLHDGTLAAVDVTSR